MDQACIVLHPDDNVAIAVRDLQAGEALRPGGPPALEAVARGHKLALRDIAAGERIVKYGQFIAVAKEAIAAGRHLHTHNAAMPDYHRDYAFAGPPPPVARRNAEDVTFEGYRRADGRIGTRNYIAVVSTVNCSATVARHAADAAWRDLQEQGLAGLDGVVAVTHGAGCGMAGQGESFEALQRTLWGHAAHPNVGGVVLVGLGCEVNQVAFLMDAFGLEGGARLKALTIQEEGGTRKTIERIREAIAEMAPVVAAAERSPQPASEIVLALQCGGSDGYSGITANPALGRAVDLLVEHGGTAILSETPEIYGAEHLLIERAVSPEVAERLVERIRWWEDYTAKLGGEMNNNPTPGNKRGGLTTILEKSLGAVAKGGTTPLAGVYRYAERVTARGFTFMDSPGYDPCSITGQVASGANVICFTTGRGSVYGNKPVPSLKLATNTEMYRRMEEDMDIDCGRIVSEGRSVEELGREIFEAVVATAGGRRSKSELQGLGDLEFVPWITGAVM